MEDKSASHTKKYNADVANQWFSLLASNSRTSRLAPAPSVRIFAYSSIALYEAVLPGMPSYQSIYKHFTGNLINGDKKEYFWPAVANATLARISEKIIRNYNANPDLTAMRQLEDSFKIVFQNMITPEQLQVSIDYGRSVADIIYEWSTTDGALNASGALAICPPYVPLGTPGTWVPTPPAFAPAAGACQGNLRTFIPNVVNTTMAPPPTPYSTETSSDFYRMANELYQVSLTLTPDDIKLAQSWRDFFPNFNTPSHMLKLSSQIAAKEKLNLEDAAVFYAKLNISMSDAIAAVFKSKFHYAQVRPITYIRNVIGQNSWNTVTPTPQHPAYPATVPSAAAASVTILEKFFGNNYPVIDSTQQEWIGTWNYASLDEFSKNVGRSKILAGHNYKPAIDAGINQGRTVGNMVHILPFKKPGKYTLVYLKKLTGTL